MPVNVELVYDERTFYPALFADLKSAKALVIIQSPYVTAQRLDKMTQALASCITRSVRVCVFVREPEEWRMGKKNARVKMFIGLVEFMESLGLHVTVRRNIHEKYVIVDDSILYSGSLNALSQYDSSEEMRRWNDKEKVRNVVRNKKLNECLSCRKEGINMFPTEGDIQDQIARAVRCARRRLGLTQTELAARCRVDQRTISAIENGNRNFSLATFAELCKVLDINLHFSPWYATPAVATYIRQQGTHIQDIQSE